MKLRNKKTGEIREAVDVIIENLKKNGSTLNAISIDEIKEQWEDIPEEPKEYWSIDWACCGVAETKYSNDDIDNFNKEIGNYFETEEEAEKAVEKLKAWKRLKDKGFKVDLWDYDGGNYQERIKTGRILFRVKDYEENDKDLDLLFGGEE